MNISELLFKQTLLHLILTLSGLYIAAVKLYRFGIFSGIIIEGQVSVRCEEKSWSFCVIMGT